jgi:diguanylate cyclase (GGDEF)-like protein
LLAAVARRLAEGTRATDSVGRLGGDEFAVVATAPSTAELDRIGERLAAALDQPFTVRDRSVRLAASVGRAVFPDDASDAEGLIKLADAEMYVRKTADAEAPPSG